MFDQEVRRFTPAFPDKKMLDLFKLEEITEQTRAIRTPDVFYFNPGYGFYTGSPLRYPYVRITPELSAYMEQFMIYGKPTEKDFFFEAVQREDGDSWVFAKYSQVLGQRLLLVLNTEDLKAFLTEAHG